MTEADRLIADVLAAYGVDVRDLVPAELGHAGARAALADAIAARIGPVLDAEGDGDRAADEPWEPLPAPDWEPCEPRAATAALLAWFEARGGDLSRLEIVFGPEGQRSGRARRALDRGERLLVLPRDLMIETGAIRDTALGQAIIAAGITHDHGILSAYVARLRRDPDTPWRAFLDALPVHHAGAPYTASAEDLAPLRGSHAMAELQRFRAMILDEYELVAAAPDVPPVSLAEYTWARTIVSSRCFRVLHDGEDVLALCPVADLLDHGHGDLAYAASPGSEALELTATHELAAGAPIHLPYGAKGNHALLPGYGFALPDNVFDEATLHFPPGGEVRQAMLARLCGGAPLAGWRRVNVGFNHDDNLRRALSIARALSMDPDELAGAVHGGLVTGELLPWVGDGTDMAALVLLERAAREALDRIPDAPPVTSPLRASVATYRRGQVEVLESIIGLAASAPAYIRGERQIPHRGPEPWAVLLNDYLMTYLQMGQFVFG